MGKVDPRWINSFTIVHFSFIIGSKGHAHKGSLDGGLYGNFLELVFQINTKKIKSPLFLSPQYNLGCATFL